MSALFLGSMREQVTGADEGRASFSGSAHPATEDVFPTNFAAVDADDEITVAEDPEPFVGGSHIADEKAGRRGGLLSDFVVEAVIFGKGTIG